jgi:hypothetical protein
MIALDHIALAAATLEQGIAYVLAQTGITVPFGGQHPGRGTHNALTATGSESYLEVIARDPEQAEPQSPRMFDLSNAAVQDALKSAPRIQTFLLRTDDITRDLEIARAAGFDLGDAITASRGNLRWKIALRRDGSLYANGAVPVLLEWPEGPHVSVTMDAQGLILNRLTITTPQAGPIANLFQTLGFADPRVVLCTGETTKLSAEYTTPTGDIALLGA